MKEVQSHERKISERLVSNARFFIFQTSEVDFEFKKEVKWVHI